MTRPHELADIPASMARMASLYDYVTQEMCEAPQCTLSAGEMVNVATIIEEQRAALQYVQQLEPVVLAARELVDINRELCRLCQGRGWSEVHQAGHTHYETDAGEGCPGYHYKRIACECTAALRKALEGMK